MLRHKQSANKIKPNFLLNFDNFCLSNIFCSITNINRYKNLTKTTEITLKMDNGCCYKGRTMDEDKPSKKFVKFLYYFFEIEMTLNESLFRKIDPYTVKELPAHEKSKAEEMMIEALKEKIDRRWLYGIEEINSKRGYSFLLDLFNNEKVVFNKTIIAGNLLRMDIEAPVLEFLISVVESKEVEGTRLKALESLYWMVGHKSKDERRNELFASLLFRCMTDANSKIRKNVYDKLKDHFEMRIFTPKNDPIAKILEGEHTREEYQDAVLEFKARVEAKEITTFSVEKVVDFINKLPDKSKTMTIANCPICNNIPSSLSADMAAEESLDEYKSKLEITVVFAYYEPSIMRCSICGRLYDYDYHYDYYVCSTSDEDEYLTRIEKKKAIVKVKKFAKDYEFKKIIKCKNFLKIDF